MHCSWLMALEPRFRAQAPAGMLDGGQEPEWKAAKRAAREETGPAKTGTTIRRGRDSVLRGFSSRCVLEEGEYRGQPSVARQTATRLPEG